MVICKVIFVCGCVFGGVSISSSAVFACNLYGYIDSLVQIPYVFPSNKITSTEIEIVPSIQKFNQILGVHGIPFTLLNTLIHHLNK